jgi:uncharacterized protein involved in exopolysaccharide biosynthesis
MEHSMSFGKASEIAGADESYDLEEQLATAERRYAEARARSRKTGEECHALEAEARLPGSVIQQARARHEAAEARCKRLRQLIEDLEERLS